MEAIEHKYIEVNALKLHVAEIGSESSPAVVFLHGFPEIWYTWRHQMIAIANAGFRAIAPDYRGYGLSDHPPESETTTFNELVSDLLALLDSLNLTKVPGRAEADFGRFDAKTVVRNVYILFSRPEIPIARQDQEVMDMVDASTPLPYWFTEEDLEVYGELYKKSGFRTPLQVPYRAFGTQLNIPDSKVDLPALLIMGEKDCVLKFPGMEDYIRSGTVKKFVPNLEIEFIPEGSHFLPEQSPDEVNKLILDFLTNHK